MSKFIRQTSVIYLAGILVLRMMAMPLTMLDYTLHKEFIATHLCENRSNPNMHCAGTCYLHKQLNKSSESQESRNQKGTTKILVIDYLETHGVFSLPPKGALPVFGVTPAVIGLDDQFIGSIFHPPIAAV